MSKQKHDGSIEDSSIMKHFNYKQELGRTLKLFGSFAVAFSAISISTGIFSNFSFVLTTAGTAGIWTWPIVSIGMLMVAFVFAEISGVIPISGYSYQWVKRLANPGLGWFTGWVSFCFLFLVTPAIDSGLSPVVADLLGIEASPTNLMIIAMTAFTLQMIINIASVKLASIINNAAVYTEVIGILGMTIILFIISIIRKSPVHNLFDTSTAASGGSYVTSFAMAALMGFYTLVGFEVASNMSEETTDAHKNVPKAVIMSVLISGIFGTLFLIAVSLGITDMGETAKAASPISFIIESNMGAVFGKLFLVIVAISIFACGLVGSISATRIVYAMSRDDAFFASGIFKKVNPKTSTPIPACILLWVLGMVSLKFSSSLTLLIGSCAVLPAIYYLITVISYAVVRKKIRFRQDNFKMGKWGKGVITFSIVWLLFEIGILTIPATFHKVAIVTSILLAVGVVLYFIYFRRKVTAMSQNMDGNAVYFINSEDSYSARKASEAVER